MTLKTFYGHGQFRVDAIADAVAAFREWWEKQNPIFTDNGASFFQVSGSLETYLSADEGRKFMYLITVFSPYDEDRAE